MLAVNTKEYVISPIVGTSSCGWLTLSAASREIDCRPKIPLYEPRQTGHLKNNIQKRYMLITHALLTEIKWSLRYEETRLHNRAQLYKKHMPLYNKNWQYKHLLLLRLDHIKQFMRVYCSYRPLFTFTHKFNINLLQCKLVGS